MKEGKKLIVTIGRQYGSGGSEIGARLAKELGIHFYDKNILRMNSDQSGIKESYYYLADEKARKDGCVCTDIICGEFCSA